MKKLYPLHIQASEVNAILYSKNYFRARLLVEKRRNERLGTHSSVIVLTIPVRLTTNERYLLVDVIFAALRESDVVCEFNKTLLLFLLPDTPKKGAEIVLGRVMDKLKTFQAKSAHFDRLELENMKWDIVVYPNENIDDIFDIRNPKIIAGALDQKKTKGDKQYNKRRIALYFDAAAGNLSAIFIKIGLVSAIRFIQQGLNPQYRHKLGATIKRFIDIILSLSALLFFMPLFIAISLLIKFTSRGGIIFQQERVGYTAKSFTLYKFRTMHADSSDEIHKKYMEGFITTNGSNINNGTQEQPIYKLKDDPRITPIGKILRTLSLDELPQLFNVLKGEMSIVGPRPPIHYEVNNYQFWHKRRFLEAKPGITGLWQVSGRNSIEFDEMVRLDIKYAKNWSLLLDLKILAKTIGSMSKGQ